MLIIADSSALITLSIADSLHLLEALYDKVCVPMSVFKEVTSFDKPEASRLNDYLNGKVHSDPLNNAIIKDLCNYILHKTGEDGL